MTERDLYAYPGSRFSREGFCTGQGQGMTMRDYFAGQALANLAGTYNGTAMDPANTAKACYDFADAMLAARAVD